jgi:pimeloyl-ACP methyl ester carboxylesterase
LRVSYSAQLTFGTLKWGNEWQPSHFKISRCDARHTRERIENLQIEHPRSPYNGRNWGEDDANHPAGLLRLPTFSTYGFNDAVAGQLTQPTLVIQGLEDVVVPGGAPSASAIYNALPASMTNKVLVQIDCATHEMLWEGCSRTAHCAPAAGVPFGTEAGRPWAGTHSTVTAALIEWISTGTFDGAQAGMFTVDASGVAKPTGT